MPKAQLTTKSGTIIVIEGSADEVAAIAKRIEGGESSSPERSDRRPRSNQGRSAAKPTPQNLIASLIDGGFFRKPKDLANVKVALEEMGHFYPITTLSPALLRLVRARQLRRIRDKKRWMYTG